MRRALVPIAGLCATASITVLWSPPAPAPVLDEAAALPAALPAIDAPRTIEELRAQIADVLARERVPGVGIALVGRDGLIWAGGVGVADLASGRPVDGDTVFRVASITKMVVGLGVMRLAEQGRLALDRPLRELMPDAADNAWEASAPVTLAQTLEHTAGLDDMHPNETFVDDDAMTPAAALVLNPRSRVARWRPGTRMAYSNVGYGVAGRAIELATGEPFDAWLRREVLQPLGMRDADFRRTPALAARLATGYRAPGVVAEFRPIAHRPAGSLLASARDLAAVVQLFLRRGPAIVSPAGLARIERAGSLPYAHTDVEYGLGNGGDVSHPLKARGHDGGLPGFLSALRYIPELDAGYVMLLNGTFSFRAYADIRRLLFAYLARGRAIAAAPPTASAAPSATFYRYANPRHALFAFVDRALLGWNVTADGSGAHVDQLVGPAFELVSTKDGGYRFRFESGTSTRLARAPDGTPVLLLGGFIYAEQAAYWPARLRVYALALAFCLLMLAPFYAFAGRAFAALRGRRPVAPDLARWPAIAGLCVIALPRLFLAAADRQVLGEANPWTLAIFATTILFGISALASAVVAVRWSVHPERPSRWRRLVPTATAIAALGLALWLGANGLIGLRIWAW